ncbi:MAG TPA: hypothetical protein VLC48_04535, partial [Gemmatimonadota bacterium]|nr:hypothetical protein [Gemmatimonadota bacterium]
RLQRYSGLPWIADYRDLWSGNHWDARVAPFRWVESRFERRVLRGAARLTSVGSVLATRLAALHGKPAQVIYNGFDPNDYPPSTTPEPGFNITYIGSLYYPDQSPAPLFKALALLNDQHADPQSLRIQVNFLGTESAALPRLAHRYGVSNQIRFSPAVSHQRCLAIQAAATALLYLGWRDPAEGIVSAKIFEYLGAGRPILAVGPPGGEVSSILQGCGLANLTEDPQEIAKHLRLWLRELNSTGLVTSLRPSAAAADYTREAQAGRLAGLLDRQVELGGVRS